MMGIPTSKHHLQLQLHRRVKGTTLSRAQRLLIFKCKSNSSLLVTEPTTQLPWSWTVPTRRLLVTAMSTFLMTPPVLWRLQPIGRGVPTEVGMIKENLRRYSSY